MAISEAIVRACANAIIITGLFQPIAGFAQRSYQRPIATVRVFITPGHPINRFVPARALGAGIDGHAAGETSRQLSPANIDAMLTAGFKPLAYRLRTELAGEAWHWNPHGTWSDPTHQQGYWTSDSTPGEPIELSYGYRLPRRGNTVDQANNDGYSRIDDGDSATFWKSNPYLDEHYTHEKNSGSPQWVVIDLGAPTGIDAIKIRWANPYATDYRVEYSPTVGSKRPNAELPTAWRAFSGGKIAGGNDDERLLRLAPAPIKTRFVRVLLNQSSRTALNDGGDIRDRLGYAISELYLGVVDGRGRFTDLLRHGNTRDAQSRVYVSSTDPWHRSSDRDPDTEQPGFDFIFRSGLTHGLPMLVPVPVLYDTPENATAEIKYLLARGYPVERVELGEEPDGQFVTPEHYAALYRLFYRSLHDIDPRVQFGGPSLQDIEQSQVPGKIVFGKSGWLGAFLQDLRSHRALDQFSFFSFEWYPFSDDCDSAPQLLHSTQMLIDGLQEMQQGGLTHDIPWIMSEYGYSAFGARAEVDIDGALMNADAVARFLTIGGNAAYLYGYEAGDVIKEQSCSSGNNMLFFHDDAGHIKERTAAYWGARLLTQEWVQPGDEMHELYVAESDARNEDGEQIVTAYATHRPDGLWSLLLINKDPRRTYRVHVEFKNAATHATMSFSGPLELSQYSRVQYQLNSDHDHPYPVKAQPPIHVMIQDSQNSSIELPPYSMTVIRGAVRGM